MKKLSFVFALVLGVIFSSFTTRMTGELVWFDDESANSYQFIDFKNVSDMVNTYSLSETGIPANRAVVGYDPSREKTIGNPSGAFEVTDRSGQVILNADIVLQSGAFQTPDDELYGTLQP